MSFSLSVANATSTTLYASGFVLEVYDGSSAFSTKLGSASCAAVETWPLTGSLFALSANVTGSPNTQSIQVNSLTGVTAGGYILVGVGAADQEVVQVISTSTSGGNFINAVFLNNHTATESVSVLLPQTAGTPPAPIYRQASALVVSGLGAAATYDVALGVQTSGGGTTWAFGAMSTDGSAMAINGTWSATEITTSEGTLTYSLTAANAPPDWTQWDIFIEESINGYASTPVSSTTPTQSVTSSSTSFSFTTPVIHTTSPNVVTIWIRAVGSSSGAGSWYPLDQRTMVLTGSGSIAFSPGVANNPDSLIWFKPGTSASPVGPLNPSFESGDVGWTLGTNWGVGEGHGCSGTWSAFVAGTEVSPLATSSSIENAYKMPVTAGLNYYAQCMVDGSSATDEYALVGIGGGVVTTPPTSGTYAYIKFYNSSNSLLQTVNGNIVVCGGLGWNMSYVTAMAPSGASYAVVGATVENQTSGTVYVDDFWMDAVPIPGYDAPTGQVFVPLGFVGPDNCVHISTSLLPQASILPNQPLTLNYTTTDTEIDFSLSEATLLMPDGSYLDVPADTAQFTGLTGSTTYYFYPFIRVDDTSLQFANASPPPTSPNLTDATVSTADGCIPIGTISITTNVTGMTPPTGGSGGGGDTCPESNELVQEKAKGKIRAGDVRAGDYLLGKSLKTGQDVYRRVLQTKAVLGASWRVVNGYKVSPTEPIYYNGKWTLAFRVPGATIDTTRGYRIYIRLESDDYDEQNYYLVTGSESLLIHNWNLINPC